MAQTEFHPSIVSLVSLAAMIASNHPDQGLCQLDKLREYGVTQNQIDTVLEIARHFRDEATRKLDARFDEALKNAAAAPAPIAKQTVDKQAGSCCTPTKSGISCC
ncbi:MAG TPA: hypothetical protein VLB06_02110 [Sulfuricaulis sp.]|nr:hypothetical protein [Sulfuricaulis sp.]